MAKRLLLLLSVLVSISVLIACGAASEPEGLSGAAPPLATQAVVEREAEEMVAEAVEAEAADESLLDDKAAAPEEASSTGGTGLGPRDVTPEAQPRLPLFPAPFLDPFPVALAPTLLPLELLPSP